MSELTPRERVLLALAHKETDRVPVDFIATPEVWRRLERYLGVHNSEAVLRRLGVDLRHPRQFYIGSRLRTDTDNCLTDVWGVCRRCISYPGGGAYEEIVHHPLAHIKDANALENYPWPKPEWWDPESLVRQIKDLDAQMPYAIALPEFGDPGGIFEISWYMRGMEQFLVDLLNQPELAYRIMHHVTEFFIGILERIMPAVGDRVDLVWTSDDIAHQHGPLISTRTWKELVAPHHARLNRRIHDFGTRTMYHSCGSIRSFIPGLIELGVDVLDVLQFSADGMDPQEIKQTFGNRLCFHGGIDVQSTLPFGLVEEVRKVTRERIEVLANGGGYILSPTHNVQLDTPPENIVAMYEEAGSLSGSV